MTLEELYQFLQEENEIERIQRIEQRNVNDQHLPFGEIAVPKMPEANFFQNGNIFINKHHRYSEMPAHTHDLLNSTTCFLAAARNMLTMKKSS